MKKYFLLTLALCLQFSALAQAIKVETFTYAGPYQVQAPFQIDSLDVNSRSFAPKDLLKIPISFELLKQGTSFSGAMVPGSEDGYALHLLGFTLENTHYATATINIEGNCEYQLFVDNKQLDGSKLTLEPATHSFVIKYLSCAGEKDSKSCDKDSLKVTITPDKEGLISIKDSDKRLYTIKDVLNGTHYGGVDISPDGKYLIIDYRTTREGGKGSHQARLIDLATKRTLKESNSSLQWMPRSNKYYFTRNGVNGLQLVTGDPSTGIESVLADNLPAGYFVFSPTEDFLIFTLTQNGPKEREEIYEVLEPEDRQQGWRDRSYLAKYCLKTGILQPITFGHHNAWATDISSDGQYALVTVGKSRLAQRPTSVVSLYLLNLNTLSSELLVEDDGFFFGAIFSPDGKQALLTGSPETLNGIGKDVPEGKIPSMMDNQLYLLNLADKVITPMTKDFAPSIKNVIWNRYDNHIYFTAEDRDLYSLFKMNPANGKITQLKAEEELVVAFSTAQSAPTLAYFGQSSSNSDRLYTINNKNLKTSLIEDLSKDLLKDIELGECNSWNFTNSRGETIYGRYYLPPHFDPSKQYPMIVNYYGGCSPVSRNFESRYPHHGYAALGYIVYVVEPSGTTGFGQEFSSRHVNTAGDGVAQDIIEGTKQFCKEHSFVNAKKIGCIGASYGGFMTQYLLTQTDIFATGISHAGISDHTSYWGEGIWGYSYSEVSMAGSYPWSRHDLFIHQSPLFNVEKIHTPLLLIHGDSDTNVPVGESIQMFTALKLLGREVAFVEVAGENHHIVDYDKRILWHNTIMAWFSKWLQDDDGWWESLYKTKTL